jgi:flagellar P-ring protein precursor FlgI
MRVLARTLSCLLVALALAAPVAAGTRLKDIIDIEGVRENQLTGYGIVFGLNGSGDSIRNCPMLQQGLASMLERLGINTRSREHQERRRRDGDGQPAPFIPTARAST